MPSDDVATTLYTVCGREKKPLASTKRDPTTAQLVTVPAASLVTRLAAMPLMFVFVVAGVWCDMCCCDVVVAVFGYDV